MKLGLIQGRLSPPNEGFQECPSDFMMEFERLKDLDLSHIEWIVTSKSAETNPIFKLEVKDLPISSICADNIVDSRIFESDFFESCLAPICDAAYRLGVTRITLPLLEKSSVENDENRFFIIDKLKRISITNPKINFSLETELALDKISSLLVNENVTLTYDVGNTTAYGLDHVKYLKMFYKKIANVHLKDRKLNGRSLEPGQGDTDFHTIFNILQKRKYSGDYTMQFCRGVAGDEINQCKKHADFVRSMYDNSKKF